MSWTKEQLLRHPNSQKLTGVNANSKVQATETSGVSENDQTSTAKLPRNRIAFTVLGAPMGKPRMTQRDRWMKRDCVMRYRSYCDRIVEASPTTVLNADVYAVDVMAYIAMPDSWSLKKKTAYHGTYHRGKPDWDNIGKAVCDALFKDDSGIADGRTRKFWCLDGEQRTEIKLYCHG